MKKIFLIATVTVTLLAACNRKKEGNNENKEGMETSMETKEERNKQVIMESMQAFQNGDLDLVFKDAAPSFTDYTDGSIPPIHSIDSVKLFFKMLKEAAPDYKIENNIFLADGDHVAVIADWSGTFKNDLMGMKATGKMFTYKDVDLFTFNAEGKVTEHHSFANFGAAMMGANK